MQLCWQNEISGDIFRENKTFLAMFPEHSTQVHFSAACSEDCRGLSVCLYMTRCLLCPVTASLLLC